MKTCRLFVLGGLGLTCGALSFGGDKTNRDTGDGALRQGPKLVAPAEYGVGRLLPDLSFADVDGKSQKLSDLKEHRAVVVAISSTGCPISRKFAPTVARLEKTYRDKHVIFLHVNPSSSVSSDDVQKSIAAHGFTGPYIRDRDGALARTLGATHTTDVFVLDARRTVVYRGAVDDQYGQGYALDAPRRQYLVEAIEATLRGDRPATAATLAPGCPLELKHVAGEPPATVTYHARIARLLQSHCVECHHREGVAPFSLDTVDDVRSHAAAIQNVVERGLMPPWFAAPPPPGEKSRWSNDCSLPPQDKADLLAWLAGGQPEGDVQDAPLPRRFVDEWQIGTPDLIVQIPKPIAVKASGVIPYQDVKIDTQVGADKWVQALEIQPTAREVVHHVLIFLLGSSSDAGGKVNYRGDQQASDGLHGLFASYVPGNGVIQLPDGFGKLLPAGARLRFQIHYTPNGTATTDQLRLGMVFAKHRPQHVVQVKGIANTQLNIPPGAENHEEVGTIKLGTDTQITALMPHMHLRGKAFRYEAVLPDGNTQLLLEIPRYDPNWQLTYRLAEPSALPKGTLLRATAWFDNSRNNPGNPDPSKTVRWGQQVDEEMLIGFVEYYVAKDAAKNAKGTRRPSR